MKTSHEELMKRNVERFGLRDIERFNSCQLGVIIGFYSLLCSFDDFESHLKYDSDFKSSLAKVMRSYTDRAPLTQNKSQGTSRSFHRRRKDGTGWSARADRLFLENQENLEIDLTDLLFDEHIVNCGFIFEELSLMQKDQFGFDINRIADLFFRYFKVVILTKEEANLLGGSKNKKYPLDGIEYYGLGLKQVPKDWDKQDIYYRAWQIPGFAFAQI